MDFGLLQKSILSSLRDWGWGLRIYLLVPRQKIQTALNFRDLTKSLQVHILKPVSLVKVFLCNIQLLSDSGKAFLLPFSFLCRTLPKLQFLQGKTDFECWCK